ncbi:MAG: tRNA (N(6)-L-threonylcarbamoyladenosine(37)-C(2))-methylthiotransferase MtaB [Veillonellaceae bacterium]|nr:tRNA (N(6)-L-threonylcarbamoyladenosine(37)-C(2))-methylthiotransferase MtaB [Veillonellaceae bacterium]
MPSVAFTTLGCKVNQFETEVMEGLFKQKGYSIVSFETEADVYIINTCSVTHLGEKKSRQVIRRANRLNPKAIIAVTGCYAQVSPEEVQAIEGVDVIVGTRERHRIVELVEEAAASRSKVNAVTDIMSADTFEDIPLFNMPGRTRAFLKIQEGCTNFCTYCIIPYARGPLRSRSLDSISAEAQKLVYAGFKEVVLTGIHLGAYGQDLDNETSLVDAVKAVLSVNGLIRLRLGSLESIEVSDELIGLMGSEPKLCQHLHLPLQAGDDSILAAMNRHYTTQEYKALIENIRQQIPGIAISTDIIVGFPGETDEMFNNALRFVDSMNFSRMHIFPYSRRSGTPAADYPNQVTEETKKYRAQAMGELAVRKTADFEKQFIGTNVSVLFETEQEGIVDGLAGNYIRVYASGHADLAGSVKKVQVDKIYKDGLWGTIID